MRKKNLDQPEPGNGAEDTGSHDDGMPDQKNINKADDKKPKKRKHMAQKESEEELKQQPARKSREPPDQREVRRSNRTRREFQDCGCFEGSKTRVGKDRESWPDPNNLLIKPTRKYPPL